MTQPALQPVDIVVLGSYNRDIVLSVEHFPAPGETCLSQGRMESPGGKGSNQAIQAAKCGASTAIIAALGRDGAGDDAITLWTSLGVETSGVVRIEEVATGMAMILVNGAAENLIVVDSGANAKLAPNVVLSGKALIAGAQLVVAQLETPVATTIAAFELARRSGLRTLLNAAPAPDRLDPDLIALTDVLCINEGEGFALTGLTEPGEIGAALLAAGPELVILTLGADGAMLFQAGRPAVNQASPTISPVDTTGAGDAFIGAFAARWLSCDDAAEAVRFAAAAGAFACLSAGAAASYGDPSQIEALSAKAWV